MATSPEPQHPASQPTPPRYPGTGPAQPPPAPDDLDYRNAPGNRIHLKAHQRGTDATALGKLALHVPGFLISLLVVVLATWLLDEFVGLPYWIPTVVWVLSGALVFHRPTEDYFARYLLGLRRPMPGEMARLAPVWREVTARAGVDGRRYELWVENSQDLNAYAAAGHIVGITQYALEQLPSAQLAAVLAHELGHHTGGHAWSSLLGYWYALPGRTAWRAIRTVVVFSVTFASDVSWLATTVLIAVIGALTVVTVTQFYGLPLLLLALPYLMAAVARRSELRADAYAAVHGFGPKLAEVLQTMHGMEQQTLLAALPASGSPTRTGPLARLLCEHPDYPTRLLRLQPYLRPAR
ncbi:M48 family metalloprotease [Streptomyces melanogenes]|uniref:M48 family metalloprotease n=1 Tax=Streptomyces melanogenes TaxID=67326 RepID=UPI003788D086